MLVLVRGDPAFTKTEVIGLDILAPPPPKALLLDRGPLGLRHQHDDQRSEQLPGFRGRILPAGRVRATDLPQAVHVPHRRGQHLARDGRVQFERGHLPGKLDSRVVLVQIVGHHVQGCGPRQRAGVQGRPAQVLPEASQGRHRLDDDQLHGDHQALQGGRRESSDQGHAV